MANCPNRNTQEYKILLIEFKTNIATDNVINNWQSLNKSDEFPTVYQAKELLKESKVAFALKQKEFAQALLSNLSRLKLISKYENEYWVNGTAYGDRFTDSEVLESNKLKIYRYLDINKIPRESVQFIPTPNSTIIKIKDDLFTAQDILPKSRNNFTPHTLDILVHLQKLFPQLEIQVMTPGEAEKYYDTLPPQQKALVPFDKIKSFVVNGKAVLIQGRVTAETAIEEVLHPFVDALLIDNPALFNGLLKDAAVNFPQLKQTIDEAYNNKRRFTQKDRDLELVTQALVRHFKKEYETNPTESFKTKIQKFIQWFGSIVNDLYKYLTGKNLSDIEKEQNKTEVKPGVAELFESNPELANNIYEALGIYNVWHASDKKIDKFISENVEGYFANVKKGSPKAVFFTADKAPQESFLSKREYQEQFAVKMDNPLVVDTKTDYSRDTESFKELVDRALLNNYDGVIVKNVDDNGFVGDVYISLNAEKISKITPQQKQQAQQLYSQYLDSVFPDSKVKDIVYHGSNTKIEQFEIRKEPLIHFGTKNAALQRGGVLNQVLLNVKDLQTIKDGMWFLGTNEGGLLKELLDRNILTIEQVRSINEVKNKAIEQSHYFHEDYRMAIPEGTVAGAKKLQEILKDRNIGFDYINLSEDKGSTSFAVPSQEQIHILGGKQDVKEFKKFVNKPKIFTVKISAINPNSKLTDIADMLNTSDITFDLKLNVSSKVKYSLSEEKQKTIDYVLSKAKNNTQEQIIKKLFHIASNSENSIDSLSINDITEGDDIVVLNKANHTYYNVKNIAEKYISATTAIKGTLANKEDVQLNIDLGNDFDKMLDGIVSDKTFDEIVQDIQILNLEQARLAYRDLKRTVKDLTNDGSVVIPQVVLYDRQSGIAGTADLVIITPQGKLKIVDLKTSKNFLVNTEYYDIGWNLENDSLLKQKGIDKLSTKQQHNLQVNLYRRMLENMGYQVDDSDYACQTVHIKVDIEGKGKDQKFLGTFEVEGTVQHPVSQNLDKVNMLIPENKNIISEETIDNILNDSDERPAANKDFLEDGDLGPEDTSDENNLTEFNTIFDALNNYQKALIKRKDALELIKNTIYLDKTKEETIDNILNSIAAIDIALSEGAKVQSTTYTSLIKDAMKEVDKFTEYMLDPNNFNNPDYINYALNFDRFVETFRGLVYVRESSELNNTQKNYILSLQSKLNRLVGEHPDNNGNPQEGIINAAITNYVKEIIKNKSSRDFTENELDSLLKTARDITGIDYQTRDMATSSDTILAIMDKIYKEKKQELYDKIDAREEIIRATGSKLLKLSSSKNPEEIHDFMLEYDEDGNYTGRYVKRLGKQYYEKIDELRAPLMDEYGNWKKYIEILDLSTASKEDIQYNKELYKHKQALATFWRAETIGINKEPISGEYHAYTQEFIDERAKYERFVPEGDNGYWVIKKGISKQAETKFLNKYYNKISFMYAEKKDGIPTGKMNPSTTHVPKVKYRVALDKTRSGKSMLNPKYEAIQNPTDALGQAQKEFYDMYVDIFENQLLNKLPMGQRDQMLGKVPLVKARLFEQLKNDGNFITKLWAKTTRSISNLTTETSEMRRVVVDENGQFTDSLPIFYVGNTRSEKEMEALENEITSLQEQRKNGAIKIDPYNKKLAELNGKLNAVKNKPSKAELSKDITSSLLKFSGMAEHYETMGSIENTLNAMIEVLEKRSHTPANEKLSRVAKVAGEIVPVLKKRGGIDNNVLRRAKKFMSMVYYDNEDVTKGMMDKITNGLIEYSSLSYVAFNAFGNFNNYAMGRLNNTIEMMGQRYVSAKSYGRAELEYNKRAIPDMIERTAYMGSQKKGYYDPQKPFSKYEALVDLFRMMDKKDDIRETGGSKFSTAKNNTEKSYYEKFTEFGYIMQDAAEYNVQTKMGMAILMDQTVMNKTTGETLSMYDAFEFDIKTHSVKLKDGFDTIIKKNGVEVAYTDQFRYELRNKIREVNKQVHGNYAYEDRMLLQTTSIGKLAAQFHKWVGPAIRSRFQKEYFDENLGWMEGRYKSFLQFMSYAAKNIAAADYNIKNLKENFTNDQEYSEQAQNKIQNTFKTLGEIGLIMLVISLKSLMDSLWSDDDDDSEIQKKLHNIAIYQADRLHKEMIMFIPVPGGFEQIYQMAKSPIAATRTLGEMGQAVSSTMTTGYNGVKYLASGNPEYWEGNSDVVYQRNPKKGKLKMAKEWKDAVPILYDIQKWENFSNIKNFYIK